MKRSTLAVALLAMAVLSVFALAQESGVTVQTAQHDEFGTYLTDGEGMSLYLFTSDSEGQSACYDECAQNWPPFTGEATAAEGVAGSLLGTIEREDGTTQVTYGGHPLYYFVGDENPGDVAGHGVNDAWFLVSNYGSAIAAPEEEQAIDDSATEEQAAEFDIPEEVMTNGRRIYSNDCVSCHGEAGEGAVGPGLAGNERLANNELVIRQIVRGGAFMPSFGGQLDDQQVAAVATYIRNTWGNSFGPIQPEEVPEMR